MSDLIVGLTGGIASGKTAVSNIFEQFKIDIIDADVIAREVVAKNSPALNAIAAHFGNDFLLKDGQLNRALLRTRIFNNPEDKAWLNSLLHPLIRQNIITQTAEAKSQYCILVAPLLVENNLIELVNSVLVVDVSEDTQIARTVQRDKCSIEVAKAIIASQTSRSNRIKVANEVINNDNICQEELKNIVLRLHKKYLTLTKMV